MKRTVWLQETKRNTQRFDAARLLGVCARTFRRYIDRYEEEGLDGLLDKRLTQVSHRRAPGRRWDLIVTMGDATNEHYSMFFCEEEGTQSSFRGLCGR